MTRSLTIILSRSMTLLAMSAQTEQAGRYAALNGLKMYYEIHGGGKPLVLIHGGGSTIESTFGRVLPELAKSHQVIAVELQAHGHTLDIDRALSFEQDADDVAALLAELHINKADFMGFSNDGRGPASRLSGPGPWVLHNLSTTYHPPRKPYAQFHPRQSGLPREKFLDQGNYQHRNRGISISGANFPEILSVPTRQNSELCVRQSVRKRKRMLGKHDVLIAVYHQRRRSNASDLIIGDVLKVSHPRDVTVEHDLQSIGIGLGLQIRFLQWLWQHVQGCAFEPIEEAGLHAIAFVSGGSQNQLVHQLRMADRDLQTRRAAVTLTSGELSIWTRIVKAGHGLR
jgi:hypothetical protein